jgi:phosphatidate cytidylyltransferase
MQALSLEGAELQKRVITALIGATVLVLLIVYGGWLGICLIATVLSMGMIHEFSQMTFTLRDQSEKRYALLFITWFVGIANFILPRSEFELLSFCFLGLFTFYLLAAEQHSTGAEGDFFSHFKELMYSLFGVLYLVFTPLYLTRIQASTDGMRWTIVFFLIVWAGDTAAYFVGKKYGKRKLYPTISPKKTLEGAGGGLLAGVFVAMIFKLAVFRGMPWASTLVVPIFVGVFAQIGDLCESFLKRAYGKKDSGSVLPGHGGFLDRFDGIVFSLPVMYACIRIFGS